MHHSVALNHRINVHFYSEYDGVECMFSCITLCSRREMNLLWSIANDSNIVLLITIAMHDPTIYLI